MTELMSEQEYGLLAIGICPDCSMPGLRAGPRGGMNRNEACPSCGAEFNVARFGGEVVMAHRNPKPDRERLFQVFGIVPERG